MVLAVTTGRPFQGSLFSEDFLGGSIAQLADWRALDDAALDGVESALRGLFDGFPVDGSPNESQTEEDLIWPVLARLGWTASLRQQNLSARGREDVPDGLLFEDDAAKRRANGLAREWRRYGFGLAIVESKRWLRPLDRRSGWSGEETAPSTQMLRYLRRVDDLTAGGLRWGILTNGGRWRLYWQGALSVSEQFLEIDLAAVLGPPGRDEGLFALDEAARRHWLKVFALMFGRTPEGQRYIDYRDLGVQQLGSIYERLLDVRNGDVNLYSLFVECAMALVNPEKKLLTNLVTICWSGKNQSRNERIRYK